MVNYVEIFGGNIRLLKTVNGVETEISSVALNL
jgi:hypothetical protein